MLVKWFCLCGLLLKYVLLNKKQKKAVFIPSSTTLLNYLNCIDTTTSTILMITLILNPCT